MYWNNGEKQVSTVDVGPQAPSKAHRGTMCCPAGMIPATRPRIRRRCIQPPRPESPQS